MGSLYVRTLARLRIRQPCPSFRRDPIALGREIPAQGKNARVHNLLGPLNHLARHLILRPRLSPRCDLSPRGEPQSRTRSRPYRAKAGIGPMKIVIAIIKPFKLEEVRDAL